MDLPPHVRCTPDGHLYQVPRPARTRYRVAVGRDGVAIRCGAWIGGEHLTVYAMNGDNGDREAQLLLWHRPAPPA